MKWYGASSAIRERWPSSSGPGSITTPNSAPGARRTHVLVPSRVIGPGLGARSSVTQPGNSSAAVIPPTLRCYVDGGRNLRTGCAIRLGSVGKSAQKHTHSHAADDVTARQRPDHS